MHIRKGWRSTSISPPGGAPAGRGRATWTPHGGAAALLVAAAGAIHLYLWFDYFHRVPVVGVLFLVNAAVGLLTGAALLARRNSLVLLLAGGYAVSTLAAFVASTRWGLFGYRETFWGSWQEAAGGGELTAALLAAFLFTKRWSAP